MVTAKAIVGWNGSAEPETNGNLLVGYIGIAAIDTGQERVGNIGLSFQASISPTSSGAAYRNTLKAAAVAAAAAQDVDISAAGAFFGPEMFRL